MLFIKAKHEDAENNQNRSTNYISISEQQQIKRKVFFLLNITRQTIWFWYPMTFPSKVGNKTGILSC